VRCVGWQKLRVMQSQGGSGGWGGPWQTMARKMSFNVTGLFHGRRQVRGGGGVEKTKCA